MLPLEGTFAQFVKLLNNNEFAVACSGGPDSMALTLLAAHWAKAAKRTVIALTVDHGLRKESAKEAAQVGKWLDARGIRHAVLTWTGVKPARNLQEAARTARYGLLSDYCRMHGIPALLLAHHLEDQAETFLLRLARGSGVGGLSAMAAASELYGITLLRPLLKVPKAELLDYLSQRQQPYAQDPSNANGAFERVKIRRLLPLLAEVGMDAQRLAKTADAMARARAHLEEETQKFLHKTCRICPEGYALFQPEHASEEIGLRALSAIITRIGGSARTTRLTELERLHHALENKNFKGATLGGCVFTPRNTGLVIYREMQAVAASRTVKAGETVEWDNRFKLTLKTAGLPLEIGALSQPGWLTLAKIPGIQNPCPLKAILYTLPALRNAAGQIVCVPHLGYGTENIQCELTFQKTGIFKYTLQQAAEHALDSSS